jgi:hypothetical protein
MDISSIARAVVAAVLVTIVTTAATAFSAPPPSPPPLQGSVKFELRDAKDKPVGGVVITLEAEWLDVNARGGAMAGGKLVPSLRPSAPKVSPSDGNGNLVVPAACVFAPRQPATRQTGVFLIQQQRRLGAFVKLKPADLGQAMRVTLEPLVFVHSEVDSPDMEGSGHLMKRAFASATVSLDRVRTVVAKSTSENGRFGVLLPAGGYDLTPAASPRTTRPRSNRSR